MTHEVELTPAAREDPIDLRDWIAVPAGDYDVADAYVDRIEVRIGTLAAFPARGTPRPDLGRTFARSRSNDAA